MFILPFLKKKSIGFSICPLTKPILFICAFISYLSASSVYHSILYEYSIPYWGVPFTIMFILPFGYRIRVALSEDNKTLCRQTALFGFKLTEKVYEDELFSGFSCIETKAMDSQYYFVVIGENTDVSVHFQKLNKKEIPTVTNKLSLMLGF